MIKASPRLRTYLTGLDDDSSILRISLQHMPIYMAWARSAARLANKPIRYVIFDEVDKYTDTAGKREADPISLGEARTTTFRHNRKIWKISTPTIDTGNIWKALTTEAQAIFDFWVQCPACKVSQKMTFGQIKWAHKDEPDTDGKCHSEAPETIEAEKLAWYECPHCLVSWSDYDRDSAVRHGKWRERQTEKDLKTYLREHRPVKIGFHLPSWLSPFVSLSSVAAAFLRGLKDINKFKDFYNKHLAEPWKLIIVSKDEAQILAARCELPEQTVPESAVALTIGVDVQLSGFWFVVRAWAPDLTNWLIHYGFLATWEDVEKLIFESSYPVAGSEKTMRIFRAAIDTGGGKKYEDMTMTEETYFWLLKNRGRGGVALWGTKGSSSAMPGMLSLGNAIMSTPSGKKLPGALRLLSVSTEKAKDQYHYRLQLATKKESRDLPGAAFLHADTGTDYVAQILAEQKQLNDRGGEEWVNIHQRANHLLDAEVLAAACVEMEFPGGGLRLLAGMRNGMDQGGAPKKRRTISRGME
jgi:phage terminase large subunit GpA-like protein